jgi:uncharacterized protein (TIGR03437 family)
MSPVCLALLALGSAAAPPEARQRPSIQDLQTYETVIRSNDPLFASLPPRNITPLTSGLSAVFYLPGTTGMSTLYGGDFAFSINVPAGTTKLEITTTATSQISLFVHFGAEPSLSPGAPNSVLADHRSLTTSASKTITITPASTPPLRNGTYFIAFGIPFSFSPDVIGAVTATLDGTQPPTDRFALTVTVNNAGGGAPPAAGSARVELFTSAGASAASPQTIDSSQRAYFTQLPRGDYRYRVYYTAGAFGSTEYWGEQTVNVTMNASAAFTRNMPWVSSVTVANSLSGARIDPAASVPVGSKLRADFSLVSAGTAASVQLRLDRDLTQPHDVDMSCGSGTTAVTCSFTVPAAGTYRLGYVLSVGANATDTGAWRQAFVAQEAPPPLLISAGELYDAAGFQRGNLSPGSLAILAGSGFAAQLRGCAVPGSLAGPLPYWLADVTISFRTQRGESYRAPMFSVCNIGNKPTVTFQIPYELPAETVSLTLTEGSASATAEGVALRPASPGLFGFEDSPGKIRAVVFRANGTLVTAQNPLRRNERGRLWAIGLGACAMQVGTNQSAVPGTPPSAVNQVILGLGDAGMNVVSALYTGGVVGIYEIVFDVAPDAATGSDVPIVVAVTAGGTMYWSNPLPTVVQP